MTDASRPTVAAAPQPAARALARGVTATWWYTAGSVMIFQAVTLFFWLLSALADGDALQVAIYLAAAAVSLASSVPLLARYGRRRRIDDADEEERFSATVFWSLLASAVAAVAIGVIAGSVLSAAALMALAVMLLRWRGGVRIRLIAGVVVVLMAVWVLESALTEASLGGEVVFVYNLFSVLLPPTAVVCLWWWDIVLALDEARAAEGRLAAAQERLRLAGDLHDLQGHHLQVIALQLELAERMLPRDPDAAAEQVRLARASVDEARSGTRALAARFRGVPLPDELANAADLLRAAGLSVELDIDSRADAAPADILGPVVRESTTNILKHGGGAWARFRLALDERADGRVWRLGVSNDLSATAAPPPAATAGSGLPGIAERVGSVGGAAQWDAAPERFTLEVTVPAASVGGLS
ncbi:two-component system sensor histidine kinase DesK [Microbacterium sp. SLBN-154]|uniref:sensor histidine kinase n=1 Tax=Microbacterium sp. SLBN-154 TaxID=2768458 RepID=UPI00116D3DB8|nr:histidine kinase [Microbacterium sp. SLBN-154]TQK18875.1 two-component system sensor histidine kinase DesK [Microbacterium sp. SLBN-154]